MHLLESVQILVPILKILEYFSSILRIAPNVIKRLSDLFLVKASLHIFWTVTRLGQPWSLIFSLKSASLTSCRFRLAAYWAELMLESSSSLTFSLCLKLLAEDAAYASGTPSNACKAASQSVKPFQSSIDVSALCTPCSMRAPYPRSSHDSCEAPPKPSRWEFDPWLPPVEPSNPSKTKPKDKLKRLSETS